MPGPTITGSDAVAILQQGNDILQQIAVMQGQLSTLSSRMNNLSLDIRSTKHELSSQITQVEQNMTARIMQTERNLRHDILTQTAYATSETTKVAAEAVGDARSSLESKLLEMKVEICEKVDRFVGKVVGLSRSVNSKKGCQCSPITTSPTSPLSPTLTNRDVPILHTPRRK